MPPLTLEVEPEAGREYDSLLRVDHDTNYDLGEHFRRLEAIVQDRTLVQTERPMVVETGISLYGFYGRRVLMFIALRASTLVLVHLAPIGTEHEQRIARERAVERTRKHFGAAG